VLELNARVEYDILGELRIFIQSRFLLFRRRHHPPRSLTRAFLYRFFFSFVVSIFYWKKQTRDFR